ncbi:MAG: metallophosphoesterase [Alphaproteobacteria bacterium]|nr:metallophosphoesterase [Alphaproteobacteria bacterium]
MRHHWFIGDIHGCLDALRRLEDRLRRASEAEGGEAHFVSVGDLVDRGPDSAGVVAWFRRGAAAGTHSAILGNHEEMMLRCVHAAVPAAFDGFGLSRWVVTGDLYREASTRRVWLTDGEASVLSRLMWLSQGGTPTLASWGVDAHDPPRWRIPEDDLAWLCSLPLVFECDGAVATHALVDADDLARLRDPGTMDGVLRDTISRTLWRRSLPKSAPDPRVHVSGHTPLKRVRRYDSRRVMRVDTGCYLGRRLSAWCPELDRVVSVEGQLALPC